MTQDQKVAQSDKAEKPTGKERKAIPGTIIPTFEYPLTAAGVNKALADADLDGYRVLQTSGDPMLAKPTELRIQREDGTPLCGFSEPTARKSKQGIVTAWRQYARVGNAEYGGPMVSGWLDYAAALGVLKHVDPGDLAVLRAARAFSDANHIGEHDVQDLANSRTRPGGGSTTPNTCRVQGKTGEWVEMTIVAAQRLGKI